MDEFDVDLNRFPHLADPLKDECRKGGWLGRYMLGCGRGPVEAAENGGGAMFLTLHAK